MHTGAGKGKSTAAFGMALRAWNQGFDVAVFQFVKSAKWKVGEEARFRELGRLHDEHGVGGPVEWHKMGSGWSWSRKAGTDVDHAAAAADGWAEIARRLAESATTSMCSTSSPIRSSGAGWTSTTWSRCSARGRAPSTW